jgi:uncharacterized protein
MNTTMNTVLLVMAKAPVAGLAKTRLCPPASPRLAAQIAAASLLDTLQVARSTGRPVVVALTGDLAEAENPEPLRAALASTDVLTQCGRTFGDRIANAHAAAGRLYPGSAVLQIGSDTPQVTAGMLNRAANVLERSTVDGVLGPATDGGWWALGLRDPLAAKAIRDVPMSRPDTCDWTLASLHRHLLDVALLPELSDVDTWDDAERVALECGQGRFADAVLGARVHAAG